LDIVVKFCSDCHEPESRIMKARRSDEGWQQILSDMSQVGSRNTDDDSKAILTYLTKNYGCEPHKVSGTCDAPDKPTASH
jgi:hypothetical protein